MFIFQLSCSGEHRKIVSSIKINLGNYYFLLRITRKLKNSSVYLISHNSRQVHSTNYGLLPQEKFLLHRDHIIALCQ